MVFLKNSLLFRLFSWGVGHSTGLLLVGGIFIFKDYLQYRNGGDENDEKDPIDIPDSVDHFFESLVGLFMLALGAYGFRNAYRMQREQQNGLSLGESEDEPLASDRNGLGDADRYRDDASTTEQANNPLPRSDAFHDEIVEDSTHNITLEMESYQDSASNNDDGRPQTQRIKEWTERFSTKTLALLAGIVHGLAGPGGVLGIVPAVQLHDYKLATCYLGSFCVSSAVTMGLFACMYGTLSSCMGKETGWKFLIQCFSSSLSVVVGMTWLVLLSLGKLEDVFP